MFKIDLHTHSVASPDGGISAADYKKALDNSLLDAIAVTDHNTAEFALTLHEQLGEQIIVGEEIMTTRGELIGLFLTATISGGQTPEATVEAIKAQGGIVYVPHPFETVRKGLGPHDLEAIANKVDIVEVCNGRAFLQNRSSQAVVWARFNQLPGAASSDAHGYKGLGKTYSDLKQLPTKANLVEQLKGAVLHTSHPSPQALLYPKYHRFRKRLRRQA